MNALCIAGHLIYKRAPCDRHRCELEVDVLYVILTSILSMIQSLGVFSCKVIEQTFFFRLNYHNWRKQLVISDWLF